MKILVMFLSVHSSLDLRLGECFCIAMSINFRATYTLGDVDRGLTSVCYLRIANYAIALWKPSYLHSKGESVETLVLLIK